MRRQDSGAMMAAVGCALAVTCAWHSDALAQEVIINDSFRSEQQARIQSLELVAGEAYAADFTIPAAWLPIEMLGVRVVMVSDSNSGVPPSGYCGRYAVEVYEEPAGGSGSCTDSTGFFSFDYQPPGAEIYSMTRQFISDPLGFVVNADTGNFQDLLFATINNDPSLNVTILPVVLTNPKVRVALRALDLSCGVAQGQKFPLILTDADGIQADNWVDGYFAGGITSQCPTRMNAPQQGVGWNWYDWRSFEPFAGIGVSQGDFVIRLILDRNVVNPMPDAGMEADSGMGSGADMGADIGADTGIVVVDMAPDGTILDMRGGTEEDLGNADSGGGVDVGNGGGDGGSGSEDTGGNTGGGDELALEAISPSSATSDASTDVLVLGEGFELGLEVSLNARKIGVVEVTRERITANVPSGLEEGVYDVIVTNPDGESAILVGAFTVTGEGGSGSGDADGGSGANGGNGNGVDAGCGCRSTSAGAQGVPASMFVLALVSLVALRRRRARA